MRKAKGFTLVELMVVILIVAILAAVAIPILRGRIDAAKWSEANAAAGTIRTAVRAYTAEQGVTQAQTDLNGQNLTAVSTLLGFNAADLTGTYFVPGDYVITSVNADGVAVVTVTASQANAPAGSYQLEVDGDWVKQ